MIEVEALTKHRAGLPVLDAVSLRGVDGGVTVLVGPSGGGKSTLLRCLNGLETFEGGGITIAGHRLAVGPHSDVGLHELRRDVGMVFQQFNLFPHLTALENVTEAPVHVLRKPREQAVAEAKQLLDRVGLAEKLDSLPHQLSGGQQQRVAIARALVLEPKVLLCDESVSMLDAEVQADVLALLRDLQQRLGLGLLFVTHDLSVASGFCHRVIVLDGGVIVEEGPGARLLSHPQAAITRKLVEACPRLPSAA